MTATAAEALELALWLHRVPARREMLLGRPLPDGIGQLLRVAGGARDQLEVAAATSGQPESEVLEAVRFYLQQVLFHEDADAYRLLGLRPDASHAQAREHHRLLQHWLHPDRRDSDEWESIYAGRVNSAWTRLRTPQARKAYDEALALQVGAPGPGRIDDASAGPAIPVARWQSEAGHAAQDRSRMVALGVLAGCVGLLLVIALRPDQPPPRWKEGQLVEATEADAGEGANPFAALGNALVREPPQPAPAVMPPPRASPRGAPRAAQVEAPPPSRPVPARPRVTEVAVPPDRPERRLQAPRADARPPTVSVAAIEPAPLEPRQPAAPVLASTAPAPTFALVRSPEPDLVPSVPVPEPLARMTQARDRARLVVAYLGDTRTGQPPVWNDLHTAREAERIRKALHHREVSAGGIELELRESKWRLSADGARLDSGYRTTKEHGQLGIDFVWREDQLLVRTLTVVPAS